MSSAILWNKAFAWPVWHSYAKGIWENILIIWFQNGNCPLMLLLQPCQLLSSNPLPCPKSSWTAFHLQFWCFLVHNVFGWCVPNLDVCKNFVLVLLDISRTDSALCNIAWKFCNVFASVPFKNFIRFCLFPIQKFDWSWLTSHGCVFRLWWTIILFFHAISPIFHLLLYSISLNSAIQWFSGNNSPPYL